MAPAKRAPNRAERRELQRTKVPARRINSDDCKVTVDGEDFFPHVGEWVEIAGGRLFGEVMLNWEVSDMTALEGKSPSEQVRLLNQRYEKLLTHVLGRVKGWSWTDDDGNPYPNPPTEDAVRRLSEAEVNYLAWLGFRTSTEEARKND